MSDEIVGYLVWRRGGMGIPSPAKQDKAMRDGAMPETKKRYEEETIGQPIALNAADWKKSLDLLIVEYPAPKQEEAP